ncbi:MAG: pilus assembly protein TadG-related protein [Actinomycetota bacterium]|nr:pilus assembly protein TadG-related protein [Actinomycetota bacterium]
MQPWREEQGAVLMFVVGLAAALLVLAGLVFDGGQILAARREAYALADNAARAGAQAVDLDALRGLEQLRLKPAAAEAAARSYLDRVGHEGVVTISDDTVQVRVTQTVPLVVLPMVGLKARTVSGVGEAHAVRGVTGPGG